ncbi:LysR family transcriptional regulator [Asticcacaulis sp. AND118]|uniref:LysR family transcriptional regulator n=1 Tax=Asticcacaulis sp. AND118 TaxID=2840468 RepID=UPI001CFF89B8|nr:LysR family transcriptional regulator [Asticcacaulis sp. AND118]UDF04996.1 LysR family transcriptional regulator [Asticcacaulis sp. AND118]
MQINRSDLLDFSHFLAIARHGNFRLAGLEQGVTASALSHSLKGLEARLGVRLLNRTSRSVTLTAAGEELFASISEPFQAIGLAVEGLNRFRAEPAGRIRLNVLEEASTLLLAPVLPIFFKRYPAVELEVSVSNRMVDIVGEGFDAGIRWGGTVPDDMIARRLSADVRWVVVGSPKYLEKTGIPKVPEDLLSHQGVRIRLGNGGRYDWELEGKGREIALDVPGPITIDNTQFTLQLVSRGGGLAYLPEPTVIPYVQRGELVRVLDDWAPLGPGLHMYYSGRHQVPTGLRLLIDIIRELQPLGL